MQVEDYKWLFLDLNSYFASVEQQERPELRGRPVAIVPMETDYTMAIAASREAKAYGVKTGTGILDNADTRIMPRRRLRIPESGTFPARLLGIILSVSRLRT